MTHNYIRKLTLLLTCLLVGQAIAATGNQLKNYDIWKDLPSKTLMEMGGRF